MTPAQVGPWILVVLGAASLIAAVTSLFREKTPGGVWMAWVFGFVLVGVGSYGPVFLSDYVQLIDAMKSWESTGSEESRQELLSKATDEDLSEGARRAAIHYATAEGSDEAIAALDKALDRAPPNTTGRQLLVEAQQELKAKMTLQKLGKEKLEEVVPGGDSGGGRGAEESGAEGGAATPSATGTTGRPMIRHQVRRIETDISPLLQLSDDQLQKMRLDRSTLERAQQKAQEGPPPPPQ